MPASCSHRACPMQVRALNFTGRYCVCLEVGRVCNLHVICQGAVSDRHLPPCPWGGLSFSPLCHCSVLGSRLRRLFPLAVYWSLRSLCLRQASFLQFLPHVYSLGIRADPRGSLSPLGDICLILGNCGEMVTQTWPLPLCCLL